MNPKVLSLGEHYFAWHYGQAYMDIWKLWMNFIWFCFYFFSIEVLLSTLFDPWKRMGEEYPKGLDLGVMAQTFIVNMLMRFVGVMTRLVVIAIGLTFASAAFVAGAVILLAWTIMPVVFVALIVMGLNLIIFG